MTTSEVCVCDRCNGNGYMTHHICTCYHKGEYDVEYYTCGKCKGSGMLKKTTVVTIVPFIKPVVDIPAGK